MITRDDLHKLIDRLPESELESARRVLEYLDERASDPLLRALAEAPEDDEEETPEEAAAVEEARQEVARGEGIPWEQIRNRYLGQD
jgi:hypothetical protein